MKTQDSLPARSLADARPAEPESTADLFRRISIPLPCPESWESMTGDARMRACARCEKHVYNLSAMSKKEAAAFLLGVSEPTCVRLYRRPDGTILTSDCSPSWDDAKEVARQLVFRKVPALMSSERSSFTVFRVLMSFGAAAAVFFVAAPIFCSNVRALLTSGSEARGTSAIVEEPHRWANTKKMGMMAVNPQR